MELDSIAITRKKLMEDQNIRQQIERRAFELYMDRGCVDGGHQEDWAKAEEEILSPLIRQALSLSKSQATGKARSEISSIRAAANVSNKSTSASPPQQGRTVRPNTVRKTTTIRSFTAVPADSTKSTQTKISKRKESTAVEKAVQHQSTGKKQSEPKVRKASAKSASSFPENSL